MRKAIYWVLGLSIVAAVGCGKPTPPPEPEATPAEPAVVEEQPMAEMPAGDTMAGMSETGTMSNMAETSATAYKAATTPASSAGATTPKTTTPKTH